MERSGLDWSSPLHNQCKDNQTNLKGGRKEQNWRPITLLNCAYKFFAKTLALRLWDHMNEWTRQDQKGFIKERHLLKVVIALWEGLEIAQDTYQEIAFIKI